MDQLTLDKIVKNTFAKKDIFGAVFCIESNDNSNTLISASGNMQEDSQYYIASINKLVISAITLKLYAENKLDLEDKIAQYLPADQILGLHVYNGKDCSKSITIAHLLSLTSGLPCYLADKQANGKIAMKELEAGIDQSWPIDKVIKEVKKRKPHFFPGEKGKAKYGDTNHHILSLIIEKVTGEPIISVLKNLFTELNLTKTYVCEEQDDKNFIPIHYKSEVIHIPRFLTSTHCDIISTAEDQMTFLKAFFNGNLFSKELLKELEKWNSIFFPFKYGIGIQKFSIPRFFSPFKAIPEMIGHSGSTGSVAFYVPNKEVYITGTINQQAKPNVAFQTMIKILNATK